MVTHCIHPHVHILPEREARFPVRITMRIMQYDNAFFSLHYYKRVQNFNG